MMIWCCDLKMNKKLKVILLGFIALILFISGCEQNEDYESTEEPSDQVKTDTEDDDDGYSWMFLFMIKKQDHCI